MKKLLLIMSCISGSYFANAQGDTLLFENFDVDPTGNYLPFNSGTDTQWVNFDADALPDANSRPQEWFWSEGGFASVDSVDACLFSSSWLAGFLPGNRNWLMTPPILISDASAVLSWASAPRQTPLYVDGYSVLVSTTDNIESSFTDTLFQAAQYLSGSGFDFSAYTFSPGFVHGQDGTYIEYDAGSDSARFIGELRPFSASLAQYAGQTIYITFVHDADDDNLVSIDDILVTGTLVGVSETLADQKVSIFPNPASDKITLSYRLPATSPVLVTVYDVKGSKVMQQSKGIQIAGDQQATLDISSLAAGSYNVILNAGGSEVRSAFVKQ